MNTKLFTLTAIGVAGATLALGVGATAAQPDTGSMDEMHTAMRAMMPADVAAECDEMHASMPDDMMSMVPGRMGGHAVHHG